MFFTMFLMLQNNSDFYKDFRSTAQDDQFTVSTCKQCHVESTIVAGDAGFTSLLLQSLFIILVDRQVFDTLSFYDAFPKVKEFIVGVLKEEEVLGLQPDFEHVLEAKSLLDSVRIVRPDFLRVLLFFVLKTNEGLQKNCLLLLQHLLESKNRARRRAD